ncbi:MAG: M14 family metallopeptidase [Phycisphaerales bacterium]|nr:M14 family metallopeptidase [Phycisphaerales bacterium]
MHRFQFVIKQSGLIGAIGAMAMIPNSAYAQFDGYLDHNGLRDAMRTIASKSTDAELRSLGKSLDGIQIEYLTLSGSIDNADKKPAVLITAGIDGRHLVGTETAIRLARRILEEHNDILDEVTIYVVPRLNPDGANQNLNSMTRGAIGNNRVIDADRDRTIDEDRFDDLNGDGFITTMRRLNPPIDDQPTHLVDPEDPRLSIKPDLDEGQRATFTLYSEGLDNDGDGLLNEDGTNGVNLNQNFMHMWPEHETHAGRYPLSEPESKAIAKFVFDHENIVIAYTLGEHDNLVNLPDTKGKDISGRAPKGINEKDADLYKRIGKMYKDISSQDSAEKESVAGSFHAWLYAQRGIPSFASSVWSLPKLEADSAENDDGASEETTLDSVNVPKLTPSGIGDISQETVDELIAAYEAEYGEPIDTSMMDMVTPEMIIGFAAQAGIEVQRVPEEPEPEAEKTPKSKKAGQKKELSEDAKWLAYFEQENFQGFVPWEQINHPTFGLVEVGGFIPLAKTNPPSSKLDEIAAEQTDFVVQLIEARPMVTTVGPEIKRLADGIFEITIAIVNDGKMPTSTVFSQSSRTIRPSIVSISSDVDHIIEGRRVSRVWGINADGGRSEHHWIIRSTDIDQEFITINDPRFGNHTLRLGDQQ